MLGGVAALAALVGGTVLGVHAANGTFDDITAKRLFIKDSSGKNRVTLRGSDGELYLRDSSGKIRMILQGSNGTISASSLSGPVTKHEHKSQAHTHSASSGNVRKGLYKHSHSVTVR